MMVSNPTVDVIEPITPLDHIKKEWFPNSAVDGLLDFFCCGIFAKIGSCLFGGKWSGRNFHELEETDLHKT